MTMIETANHEIQDTDALGGAFVMASLLTGYPGPHFSEHVQALRQELQWEHESLPLSEEVGALLDQLEDPAQVDELRSSYIDTFDRGREVTSLYETEYGRERAMVKGSQLVDIAGFYHAFGFDPGGSTDQVEMLDHVAVELEFYALMVLKTALLREQGDSEGVEVVLDGRKKFLQAHLGRFVSAICDRPGLRASTFYWQVLQYARDVVSEECRLLGVRVEPEHWVPGEESTAEMTCGGTAGSGAGLTGGCASGCSSKNVT